MQEKAENFVRQGIRATNFRRRSIISFLPFNILLAVIALLLWHELCFLCVAIVYVLANIICSIVFYKKWNVTIGYVSQSTQLLTFAMALDMICYGMYRCVGMFVWYEYMIFIVSQAVVFVICIPLNKIYYKVFDNTKKVKKNLIVGCVAGFTFECAMIVCKICLTNVTLNVVVTIISLLISAMIYLLLFVVCLDFYRIYLILKYKLDLHEELINSTCKNP